MNISEFIHLRLGSKLGSEESLLILVVAQKQQALQGQSVIFSNKEIMEILGIKWYKKFCKVRSTCVATGWLVYKCNGLNQAGEYTMGQNYPYESELPIDYESELPTIGQNHPQSRYISLSLKENIIKDCGSELPIVKIEEEFNTNWPSLRYNFRSMKAQSFSAWKSCRKKYSAEQIKSAWLEKIETYPDKKFVGGFQVFAKPENIGDMLENTASKTEKPLTDAERMKKFLKPLAEQMQ